MNDQYPADEVVRCVVEAVNAKGAKLAGIGWCNFSKFGNITPPQVGEEVEATLRAGKTGGKWIQALRGESAAWPEVAPSAPPVEDDLDPATFGYQQEGQAFDRAASRFAPSGSGAAPRPVAAKPVPAKPANRATLKAHALAAAAHFHSGRAGEEGAEDDVFGTAYRFLAWLEDADEVGL